MYGRRPGASPGGPAAERTSNTFICLERSFHNGKDPCSEEAFHLIYILEMRVALPSGWLLQETEGILLQCIYVF